MRSVWRMLRKSGVFLAPCYPIGGGASVNETRIFCLWRKQSNAKGRVQARHPAGPCTCGALFPPPFRESRGRASDTIRAWGYSAMPLFFLRGWCAAAMAPGNMRLPLVKKLLGDMARASPARPLDTAPLPAKRSGTLWRANGNNKQKP